MAVFVIDKVPPYDGEHPFDLSYFTLGEEARIYDIAGLRPIHYSDALIEADAKLRVALAVVALEREGLTVEWLEPFWAARAQHLLLDLTRGPGVPEPVPPTESPPLSENGAGENVKSDSSTAPGETAGALSEEKSPSDTGNPGSATRSD